MNTASGHSELSETPLQAAQAREIVTSLSPPSQPPRTSRSPSEFLRTRSLYIPSANQNGNATMCLHILSRCHPTQVGHGFRLARTTVMCLQLLRKARIFSTLRHK